MEEGTLARRRGSWLGRGVPATTLRRALESYRRETELRRRIRHLEIRIDEVNRRREVSQITETDYFRNLRDMAQKLRASAEPGGEG